MRSSHGKRVAMGHILLVEEQLCSSVRHIRPHSHTPGRRPPQGDVRPGTARSREHRVAAKRCARGEFAGCNFGRWAGPLPRPRVPSHTRMRP